MSFMIENLTDPSAQSAPPLTFWNTCSSSHSFRTTLANATSGHLTNRWPKDRKQIWSNRPKVLRDFFFQFFIKIYVLFHRFFFYLHSISILSRSVHCRVVVRVLALPHRWHVDKGGSPRIPSLVISLGKWRGKERKEEQEQEEQAEESGE